MAENKESYVERGALRGSPHPLKRIEEGCTGKRVTLRCYKRNWKTPASKEGT